MTNYARRVHPLQLLTLAASLYAPLSAHAAPLVGIKGIDSNDVDIVVGSLSKLAMVADKFLIGENSELNKVVDKAFEKFVEKGSCLVDQFSAKGAMVIEGAVPGWLKSEEAKACEGATVVAGGTTGLSDRYLFVRCVMRQNMIHKSLPMSSVASAFSGLKETAHGSYCRFQRNHLPVTDFKLAKEHFAEASILVEAYGDMGELPGCVKWTPETAYACSVKHADASMHILKAQKSIDLELVNFDDLEKARAKLSPPPPVTGILNPQGGLSVGLLESYQEVMSAFKRSIEVVDASKAIRAKEFRTMMSADFALLEKATAQGKRKLGALSKTYVRCAHRRRGVCMSLNWPSFSVMQAGLEKAEKRCSDARTNPRYEDVISPKDAARCATELPTTTKLLKTVEAHFAKLADKQARSAMDTLRDIRAKT